jgi:hypothetical protein
MFIRDVTLCSLIDQKLVSEETSASTVTGFRVAGSSGVTRFLAPGTTNHNGRP